MRCCVGTSARWVAGPSTGSGGLHVHHIWKLMMGVVMVLSLSMASNLIAMAFNCLQPNRWGWVLSLLAF